MNERIQNDLKCLESNSLIIGVDEAGRGAWAGPVVVAAVALESKLILNHLDLLVQANDSKKLKPKLRAKLSEALQESLPAWSIIEVSPRTIDNRNIWEATKLGMREAVFNLPVPQDGLLVLVDGNQPCGLPWKEQTVIKGDALHCCIACASILAKVHRDTLMAEQEALYPGYGWASHVGYGTQQHQTALRTLGVTPIHRKSYQPIKELLNETR